jgi:hypothetical protein
MSNHQTSHSRPRKSKSVLYLKLFVSFLAIYTGIALGFAGFSPYNYYRRPSNFLQSFTTVLSQPMMELFAQGKVSHFYDWQNFSTEELQTNITGLPVRTQTPTKNFNKSDFGDDLNSIFGKITESAVIEPVNFSEHWSVIYCDNNLSEASFCQKSKLYHPGKIKLAVDGNYYIWGIDEKGNFIELRSEGYINSNERKDILYI